ncbi:glycerophosphodiester phosphodiesterase family protein [Brachybacterium sp. p3-SID957]|uniref:glycerophosphodiester phosphodiesterase family protein n=1 Tax=Brachybacterium sp. p3-SID957 TaxID=2916049 RepID=UPI00223C40F6|nr:glycerophosphodiester phosphodiesterase family protein [Brachybacterium sp. p3-SID957]MCT1775259.1 glycerophosphodiester phosphodiesterase [Brachybacterium sp. p3-SID957]
MRSSSTPSSDSPRPGGPSGRADAPLDPPSRFLPGPRPRRIAHRGLALDAAENTMRAFQDAVNAGADMLETDTRATAEGLALAFHDEDLLRIAGDARRIDSLDDRQARAVRLAGNEPLALLEDVLGTFSDLPVNIDVKALSAIEPAVRAIARTRSADRICLAGFDDAVTARAVAKVREATGITPVRSPSRRAIALFLGLVASGAPTAAVRRLLAPYGALQVPVSHRQVPVVTPRTVAAAHRAGCEVHVWTIDEITAMKDLLVMGVDGIITNRVDRLGDLLDAPGSPHRAATGPS